MTFSSVITTSVTTTVSGATYADGATLSGTWTANYNSTGGLVSVTNATFTISGPGGTNTFSSMGTLPYAQDPTASGFTSYEIHSLANPTGTGSYNALYVDWKTENPSSFYEGSPSLYTSIKNTGTSTPTTAIRLVGDGTSGAGSVPSIAGLAATESSTDNKAVIPFSGVIVTDTDSTTATSTTITLNSNGVATDADGVLTAGSGIVLTKSGTGTYTLAATSPANLTAELASLKFTPTGGQVATGSAVATTIGLAINDSDGSASASTVLTVTAVCFLAGTLIATPAGEMPVESLSPGDLVTILEDGRPVARPVTWTGRGSMDAARFDNRAEAFPVRIRKDAFSPGIPARDLLVTPEHCILTDVGLTPARMLVNGGSILVDRSIPAYAFFHLELEAHAILLAEGLPSESYLDTGNRTLFEVDGSTISARRDLVMAAPLAVARDLVEPIWTRLAERARALGMSPDDCASTWTDNPDLRLLLEDGRQVSACWHDEQRYMFHIPRYARPVRLLSRSGVPAETIGPFVDDRRLLGVAIDRIVLWAGLEEVAVPAAAGLFGWHEREGTYSWTDGNAALVLPPAGAETFLDIHVAGTTRYCAEALAA
ncbi:MAG: Hint domain-containing protein [Janthinobacterium lividum]